MHKSVWDLGWGKTLMNRVLGKYRNEEFNIDTIQPLTKRLQILNKTEKFFFFLSSYSLKF